MTGKHYLLMCVFIAAGMLHAREFTIDRMPVAPFVDTEVSTNMTINTSDISYEDLKFQFQGTPSNDLELAFGTDANTNGVLDEEEIDTRFGWRAGRYFIENARTAERHESAPSASTQDFSVELHLDAQYNTQQVRRINVAGINAAALGNLISDVSPAWVWEREWNMMRATRRGTGTPSDWINFKAAHHGFAIRLR